MPKALSNQTLILLPKEVKSLIELKRLKNNVVGPVLAYPEALIRQAVHGTRLQADQQLQQNLGNIQIPPETVENIVEFAGYDCDINFNYEFSDQIRWFFGTGFIRANELDFKLMAAKALTIGLGFHSNLEIQKIRNSNITVPRLLNINTFSKMTPLDNMIYFGPSRISRNLFRPAVPQDIGDDLNPISKFWTKFPAFINKKAKYNQQMYAHGYNLYCTLTRDRLEAVSEDGQNVPMKFNELGQFEVMGMRGIDREFLMSTRLRPGVALNQMMEENFLSDLFGPQTLRIFNEIGYATLDNPETIVFEP